MNYHIGMKSKTQVAVIPTSESVLLQSGDPSRSLLSSFRITTLRFLKKLKYGSVVRKNIAN